MKLCLCGCGAEVKNKWKTGHQSKGKPSWNKGLLGLQPWHNTSGFVKGNRKGARHSEETKMLISNSKLVDNPSHTSLHKWVRRWKGKPFGCEKCGLREKGRRYEWSNISGKYKRDLNDYESLCVPCHREKDGNNKLYLHSPLYKKYKKRNN